MADTTGISRATTASPAETVPERPAWMPPATSSSAASPSAAVKSPRRPARSAKSQPVVRAEEDEVAPMPFKTKCLLWLTSAAATGYGLSLIFHSVVLTAMALYILPGLIERDGITTVVQSDTEMPEEFDHLQDIELTSPAGQEELVKPQHTEMIEQDADLTQLEHDFLTDVTAAEAQGEGGSTAGIGGGIRLLEPGNAVRQGSFTAWTIPIAQRVGEKPKAGDNPRRGQAYYIVIQVRLEPGTRIYRVNDLSGHIVGTDGYQQLIPAQAFVQNDEGELSRAKIGRRLPIVDGVVQILIKVPGAEALVKDTVQVKSRSLKEEQTLELVFGQQ